MRRSEDAGDKNRSGTSGDLTAGLLDLDSEDVEGAIDIYIDPDDSDEDGFEVPSLASETLLSARRQVFLVKELSKARSGFRPTIMCEGFLAEVSSTASGYTLSPLGSDQQMSFKYEPPSPKFSRKRPGCLSYRLQLLHGSQFLYSLRGLPKVLCCQRTAHALEWGPVHLVFAAVADLETFLATLKYVEVEEMGPEGEELGAVEPPRQHGSTQAEPNSSGGDGGVAAGRAGGVPWPASAARLWMEGGGAGYTSEPHTTSQPAASLPAPHQSHGGQLLAATAGAAVLVAVAAACIMTHRAGVAAGRRGVMGGGMSSTPK